MGSNGHVPPHHLRRPLPGSYMMHPDPYGRPPPGAYPPFDRLPPPEVLEQKLAAQHGEVQRLVAENQRLTATHVAMRQDLAATQQELQRLQAEVGTLKHDKEQQVKGLMDKITKMENDLKAAEPIKAELQHARTDAQNAVAARDELITKVNHLTLDYQKIQSDVQQIPALISELEGLRQEYQQCRATYDYEKKLYNDHYESLQGMEKNYISMVREFERLRAELANAGNIEQRAAAPYGDQHAGAPYGATTGFKVTEAFGHPPVGHSTYEGGTNVSLGHRALPTAAASYGASPVAPALAGGGYDASRGTGYEAARGPSYEVPRGGPGYDSGRGVGYEAPKYHGYDVPPKSATGSQGPVSASGSSVPYGSAPNITTGYDADRKGGSSGPLPSHVGSGYDAQLRGGNHLWR